MNGSSASSKKSNTYMVVKTSRIAYLKRHVWLDDAYDSQKAPSSSQVNNVLRSVSIGISARLQTTALKPTFQDIT